MADSTGTEPAEHDDTWDAERVRRLAPWAEPVPGVARMDLDSFIAWRHAQVGDGWRYELVDGWLIRRPAPTGAAAEIVRRLAEALVAAARPDDQVSIAPDLREGPVDTAARAPNAEASGERSDERADDSGD